MQKSMSLEYEPASEPLHIYVKQQDRQLELFSWLTRATPPHDKVRVQGLRF